MKKTINIEGMVCGNCVMHVKNRCLILLHSSMRVLRQC